MFGNNRLVAKALALLLASYPLSVLADEPKAKTVLTWSEKSQNALFQDSITMIGIVASQSARTSRIANCIDEWFGSDQQLHSQRYDHIREVMRQYPDYHPQAVILAVVQKACGSFAD